MAAGFGITGTIVGLKETVEALKSLPGKVQRSILRPAMSKATKPVFMTARKNARKVKDTELLAKSITRKVVTYKSGALVVVIGPDTAHRQEVVRKRSWSKKPQMANPAMYAHLVEYGTRPHSLVKDDKLKRTGAMAKQAQQRASMNVHRWGLMLASASTPEQASKLQKRIASTKRNSALNRQEKQTKGGRMHPGAKAKPFLRPAFDSTRAQVQTIFAEEVRKGIEKLAVKKGIAI